MRVAVPRPRHTSHGEEKTSESGKDASGDKTEESGTNEATNENADEEQATRFVCVLNVKDSIFFLFF